MYMTETYTEQFLKTAQSIGNHLAVHAIRIGEQCNWIGSQVEYVDNKYQPVSKACGPDLYGGTAGVAWFLTELYTKTRDEVLLATLESTVNTLLSQCDNAPANFGFFTGKLGIGYTLWKIGNQLGKKAWKEKGVSLLKELEKEKIEDHEIDVVSGAAGAIPALLKLYNAEKDESFRKLALRCGEFLLDKAEKSAHYWSWKTMADEKHNLLGYSHGAAGIAIALLELYYATSDERFWSAAILGFHYERLWFDPAKGNWPDLRSHEPQKELVYGNMWCHGAPGIALSRIRAYKLTGLQYFLDEALVAVHTLYHDTLALLQNPNSAPNYSLCHGFAGNADILLTAGEELQNPAYTELAQQVGKRGIELYEQNELDWPSGVNDPTGLTMGQEETPGLMLGLAGTGLFYLRLNDSAIKTVLITTPEA